MTPEQQIAANQVTIAKLASSIGLLVNTPKGQEADTKRKVQQLHDDTMSCLRVLEIEGQRVKIENMQKAVALLRP